MEDPIILKNLLDFFIQAGVDENISEESIDNYEIKKSKNTITINKQENSAFVKNVSVSEKTEKFLENVDTLDGLKQALFDFDNELKNYCINTIFGRGVYNPIVLVLGEMPNADTDKSGNAFSGNSGVLLEKMLGAIGLSDQNNAFLSYVFPYKTPGNRVPTTDEMSVMIPFAKRLIKLLNPKIVISLGVVPLNALTDNNYTISKNHGDVVDYNGVKFVAIHEPDVLLMDLSKKVVAWEDLQNIQKLF